MKIRQILFALAFITPLVTLPIEGLFNSPDEFVVLNPEINNEWAAGGEWVDWRNGIAYSTAEFGEVVWMTANFKVGFSADPNQIIPKDYYLFKFESEGYKDPLMGTIGVNQVGFFWTKSSDEKIANYISVPNRELKYNHGKISTTAKMAVRYVKD